MNPLFSVSNFNRIGKGQPQCVRVLNELVAGVEQQVDFRDYEIDGDIFSPQGVMIDATNADADCTVEIAETKFVITCAKGAMVCLPYPAVSMQTALINGAGNTKVFFVDYPIFPYNSAASSGGGMPTEYIESIVAGDNITIDATDPKNPIISAETGGGGSGPQFASVFAFAAGGAAGTFTPAMIAIQAQSGPVWSIDGDGKLVPPAGNFIVKITLNGKGENAGGTLPALTVTTLADPLTRRAYPNNADKNCSYPFVYVGLTDGTPMAWNMIFTEATTSMSLNILIEILATA